jgi:hypothetical protein
MGTYITDPAAVPDDFGTGGRDLTPKGGSGKASESLAVRLQELRTAALALDVQLAALVASGAVAAVVADPGTAVAIPVDQSASIALVIAATGETNTLAIPTFEGQQLTLFADTLGASDTRIVTVASPVDQAGNDIVTFAAVGDFVKLQAITIAGTLRWQVTAIEGAVASGA